MEKINEVNLFIQKNQHFYEEKFKKMNDTGKSASWNWAAFFLGVYWMVYRKMYFKAGAFFILSFVASSTPYIGVILNFAVLVGIGIYANALYMDHINGSIKKVEMLFSGDKEATIKKLGGTNLPLALGLYVIVILVMFLSL